jgi:hypothetical protein
MPTRSRREVIVDLLRVKEIARVEILKNAVLFLENPQAYAEHGANVMFAESVRDYLNEDAKFDADVKQELTGDSDSGVHETKRILEG